MEYDIRFDLEVVSMFKQLTYQDIAEIFDVQRKTAFSIASGHSMPSISSLERFYDFAYKNKIYVHDLYESVFEDEMDEGTVLFHGSKSEIVGDISLIRGRTNCDFGQGFYCGQSYQQSASFVANYPKSSVYLITLNESGLKSYEFGINKEWLLCVAYHRYQSELLKNSRVIQEIIERLKDVDFIIAPIADNRMFSIIDRFIDGEITDEQCVNCLALSNLGSQYVLKSEKAIKHAKIQSRLYLCEKEREDFNKRKAEENAKSENLVRETMIKYRGVGQYIDEILK